MMNALVTGGAGFLGSHLCRRLLKDGYRVYALDNLYTGSKANIADMTSNPNFSFIEADVIECGCFNTETLRHREGGAGTLCLCASVLDKIRLDEIYNLACPASPVHYQARPIFTTKTSIFGILNMLELAKAHGAKLLHTSTSEVYGDPAVHPQVESYWGNVNTIGIRSCYDEGKRVAETLAADYIRECDVDVRMVRIFNTYGPYMHPQDGRVISNFIMQALRNEDITIFGDGSQTRSFQYCDDLIEAFRRYMALPKSDIRAFFGKGNGASTSNGASSLNGEAESFPLDRKELRGPYDGWRPAIPVINTGNPGEYTIKQLAEEVLRQMPESTSRLIYRPLPSDDPKKRKPDITLAHALLGGWQPQVPLQEGLAKTIAYFREKFGGETGCGVQWLSKR